MRSLSDFISGIVEMLLFTTQHYVDIMIPDFFGILCIGIHRQVIFVAVVSPVPTIVIRARGIR